MKLRIHILDLIKFDKLLESNEFLRKVLKERQGEWLVETNKDEHLREIERLLKNKRIRYKYDC